MKFIFYSSIVCYVLIIIYITTLFPSKKIRNNNNIRTYESLIQHVDVFYGTGLKENSESTGNLFPISSVPFGNNHWTVTTNGKSPWFFDRNSNKFNGIRCSHQPSVWIGDYSFFDMSPSKNTLEIVKLNMSPSFLNVIFKDFSELMLVPTDVGAVLKFKGIKHMVIKRLNYKQINKFTIIGTTSESSIFKIPQHTILNVVIRSNTPFGNDLEITDETIWYIGTSFISVSQAFENIPTNYDVVLNDNNRLWNSMLNRIKVNGNSDIRKFYSILYRTLLFPRLLKEPNGKHYSPYSKNGDIFGGEISTDSGFWDSYRTVYQFLHLVFPEYASRILNGYVNAIKESHDNMLPQWASPDSINSMEGTMGEISISEGIMNDAIDDVKTAWEYLYKSCFTNAGRAHFDDYIELGFVPNKVSLSLNYYLCDFVVSIVARKLGYNKEANTLLKRSKKWKLLFNHDNLMFNPKTREGKFKKIDEFAWSSFFRESSAWQNRFYVPHDLKELNMYAYGGKMCKYLNNMMEHVYKPINTRNMIHEEKELYKHMFGQYSHNNQPSHHILYTFHHVGCKNEGIKWIKKVLLDSYTDMGYPGDEDNGEMSAWYILSSIGLYSIVPGSLQYQFSTKPLWDYVNIDDGRILIQNNMIGNVLINGKHTSVISNYNSNKKYSIIY